jgi:SOS-response transcriptional repressor LexA
MTTQEYEELKTKIDSKKNQMTKNEGMVQQILNDWKGKFNLSSQEEVETYIKQLENDISTDTDKTNKLFTELKSLYNWEEV